MKQNRLYILALAALMATTVAMGACTGDSTTATETTGDTAADTTAATADTESETDGAVDVAVSLSVKDQHGNAIAGALLRITDNALILEAQTVTTDAEGNATLTLPEGSYTVNFDELPAYHLGGMPTVEVKAGMEPVALTVTDNTPDGSEQNPFFVNNESAPFKIPAGATHHFTMFGGEHLTLVIDHPSVELTYQGAVHTPGATGRIELPIVVENPRDHVSYAVKNTGDSEIEVKLELHSDPGSLGNPIAVESIDAPVIAAVPKGGIVYYIWTATADGTVKVTSADETNNISLSNKSTSQTTDFTAGAAESGEVNVKKGEEVLLIIAAVEGVTEDTEIAFSVVFTAA